MIFEEKIKIFDKKKVEKKSRSFCKCIFCGRMLSPFGCHLRKLDAPLKKI